MATDTGSSVELAIGLEAAATPGTAVTAVSNLYHEGASFKRKLDKVKVQSIIGVKMPT